MPLYLLLNRGDFLIISVTGNFRWWFNSKKSFSSKKPETGYNDHPVELNIMGEIESKSGNLSLGIGRANRPIKYSFDAYRLRRSSNL